MPDWKRLLEQALSARGHACDSDILEELDSHASTEYDALCAGGSDPGDAEQRVRSLIEVWVLEAADLRRAAKRAAPVPPPRAGGMAFAGVLQDFVYGLRLLRRQPGAAAVSMLTMALGIGATTMLFGVMYGVLLKPLPWPDADRLIRATETRAGRSGRVEGTLSNGTFRAWQEARSTIEDIGGWRTQTATLTGAGDAARLAIIPVTPSLFPVLRVQPLMGRLFNDDEGGSGDEGAVLLSYGLWQERFGASPAAIGQRLRLDEKPYTVVGVMPRDFAFPDSSARAWTAWSVPSVVAGNGALVGVIFRAIARLRDGTTPAQAAAEGTARARSAPDLGVAASALFGAAGPVDISTLPELQALTADVRPALLILLVAAMLLLATATANVASLQLARATTRRREMAVRAAIGAGQSRIVRQLLIENALLGLGGGIAGVALAVGLQRGLPALVPEGFPRLDGVAIDMRVLWFAIAISVGASVVCGVLPAWLTRQMNLVETLSEGGLAPIGGGRRAPLARVRGAIMAGQVAIACVLLLGAGLLTRSLVSLIRADRGYDPVNVLTARLPIPSSYPVERRGQLLEMLTERLRAVPGVSYAAYSTALPFVSSGGFTAFRMRPPGHPDVEMDIQATQRIVSPDYFPALRLRLVEGRLLSDADTATTSPAIVVNQTFARQYLGAQRVGSRIPPRGPRAGGLRFTNDQADWEVVGVVDDMRQEGVDAPLQPEVFASFKQLLPDAIRNFDPLLVVRTTTDPRDYVPTLRGLVQELAPTLAVDSVMTMEDRVMASLSRSRIYTVVLVGFGAAAVLIAGVGLFGVLSFSVAQRTREIGVRSALGAQARDIVALVMRQAFWIVGTGITIGVAMSLVGVRLLSTLLYAVGPHDTLTFVAVPVVIILVAAIACLVPARRAAKVDPLTALRTG